MSDNTTLPHPFLRAYMAGVAVPSLVVSAAAVVVALRFSAIPSSVERAMIFPTALNPFIWGAWNALYIALRRRWRIPIGWFGASLAILLIVSGVVLAHMLGLTFVTIRGAALVVVPIAATYFVLWKYVVAMLNRLLGASA
ncbi:MAG TPA: hypothetical protein VL156_06730 [Terriglobales bacterium]|nr:hypothetical protein [Terriglobales bacterium]